MNKLLVRARCGDASIINLMKGWKSRKALIKKLVLLNELWIHGYNTHDFSLRLKTASEIRKLNDRKELIHSDAQVQRIVDKLAKQRRERVLAGL